MEKGMLFVVSILALSTIASCASKTKDSDDKGIIITASYYPWYYPIRGKWDDGITGMPLLGFYDSKDHQLISQHIEWATEYGISGFFVEWTGLKAPAFDDALKLILENPDSHKIKFSLTYAVSIALGTVWEQGAQGIPQNKIDWTVNCSDPAVQSKFIADIDYAAMNYFWRVNFLKVEGKPVFYMWASAPMRGDVVGMIRKARMTVAEKYGIDMYLIGEEITWNSTPDIDRVKAFDALMPYIMINSSVLPSESYNMEDSLSSIMAQYEGWSNVCKDLGIGFIPGVFPGYNDKNRTVYYVKTDGKVDTQEPVVMRGIEGFRAFCTKAREFIDPNIGLINIASWNEWFEGSTIEPSKQYGFNYLEVVKETLSSYERTASQTKNQIKFIFNKAIRPCDIDPTSSDTRYNAIAFDYIKFLDKDEKAIGKIDIGTDEARRYMGLGWSGNERHWDAVEDFVWTGGIDKYSTIYIMIPKNAVYLEIHALPIVSGISLTILIEGNDVSRVDTKLGWNRYKVLISMSSISLNLSQGSISINSSIGISGTITPAGSIPIYLEYKTIDSEWKALAMVMSISNGSYSYTWTPPALGTFELTASCPWGASYTGAISAPITLVVTKLISKIALFISEPSATLGSSITIYGSLVPPEGGAQITLNFTKPDASTVTTKVATATYGSFTYGLTADKVGSWSVRAFWAGSSAYEAAENLTSFTVTQLQSSISCAVSKQKVTLGDSIIISGVLNPGIDGEAITLVVMKPDGQTYTSTVLTGAGGEYSFIFKPEDGGKWKVEARWHGSETYLEATSYSIDFIVEQAFPIIYAILGVMTIGIVISLFIDKYKRKMITL